MAEQRRISVNVPVKDLKASVAFFTELGFEFDPRYTNEDGHQWEVLHMDLKHD